MNFDIFWSVFNYCKELTDNCARADEILNDNRLERREQNLLLQAVIGPGTLDDKELLESGMMHFLGLADEKFNAIGWTQYRPYWNDGDTCDFYVNSVILIAIGENEEDHWDWDAECSRDAQPFLSLFSDRWLEDMYSDGGHSDGMTGGFGIDREGNRVTNLEFFEEC